jgi:hypothetical protein
MEHGGAPAQDEFEPEHVHGGAPVPVYCSRTGRLLGHNYPSPPPAHVHQSWSAPPQFQHEQGMAQPVMPTRNFAAEPIGRRMRLQQQQQQQDQSQFHPSARGAAPAAHSSRGHPPRLGTAAEQRMVDKIVDDVLSSLHHSHGRGMHGGAPASTEEEPAAAKVHAGASIEDRLVSKIASELRASINGMHAGANVAAEEEAPAQTHGGAPAEAGDHTLQQCKHGGCHACVAHKRGCACEECAYARSYGGAAPAETFQAEQPLPVQTKPVMSAAPAPAPQRGARAAAQPVMPPPSQVSQRPRTIQSGRTTTTSAPFSSFRQPQQPMRVPRGTRPSGFN